jgi:hypothetical protein
MYRNGRPVDPGFLATERLFFRCRLDSLDGSGRIKPAEIHFPDQSVNREKYSRRTDVLLPDGSPRSKDWLLHGVAEVEVRDLPPETRSAGDVAYQFKVEHDPMDDNYAHSELRVYKDKQRETDKKRINAVVKKQYRTELALRTRVVVQPLL